MGMLIKGRGEGSREGGEVKGRKVRESKEFQEKEKVEKDEEVEEMPRNETRKGDQR